jgi:beta-lactamase class D OXA-2
MNFDLCGLPQHKPRTCHRRGQFARCVAAIAVCALAVASNAAEPLMTRPDWSTYFVALNATGTMVVRDERTRPAHTLVYNMDRANQRFSPASTFKIPHAAFALEAGLVRDEFQVFKWDGTKRSYEAWNADQDLRSSMRDSVVWVYQGFARDIGGSRAKAYLESVGYGNANPSGGKDGYWIDGNLRISALEQVAFLQRLYRNDLPFQVAHQRLVKDIMIVEAGDDWVLRAKTGWEGRMGWWVGWVERPAGPVFFALNIDTPNRKDDLYKRRAIAELILRSIKALPAK